MKLRKLNQKDLPYMLEWMHDSDISRQFRTDFSKYSEEHVLNFIISAQDFNDSRHYAIVDDSDEYLGTISLKNIDQVNQKAEYAIVLRKKAQGKNVATQATRFILEIAFNELNLHKVYLNVLATNEKANQFYRKFGFTFEGVFRQDIKIATEFYDLNWYSILKESYESLD